MTSAMERAINALPKPKTDKIPASKTFLLEPKHFADTWSNKPVEGILIGIRVPSEKEVQGARTEAIKVATNAQVEDDDPNADEVRIQAFNDSLMSLAVASALCDPADVMSPHPFFELADEFVPMALKSKTIQYIWDLIEQLHIEQSPIFAEITPEEELMLIGLLSEDDPYAKINKIQAKKARRFLRFALDILEE